MKNKLIADYLNLEDGFWNALDAGLSGYDSELDINSRNEDTVKGFCQQMSLDRYVHAVLSYEPHAETGTYWISFTRAKKEQLNLKEALKWPL